MKRLQRTSALGATIAIACAALAAQPALAGCAISVTYKNDFSDDIQINAWFSQSKIQGGFYSRLKNTNVWVTIPAYGEKTRNYTLDLGCNHDRRYKFHMVWAGNPYDKYKPSANGWTRSTNITVRFNWPFP